MVAKGAVITHGSNAVRYSSEKDKAEIVKVNHLPENISSSSMWARMVALQMRYKEKLNKHHPLKNNSIRIELSPAKEETVGWTIKDWQELAEEFVREFDSVDLSGKAGRDSAKRTNLQNTQYVVSLHHDSKGQILHLHINANRIDMEGNVNDAHYINDRAMIAANTITQRRGWVLAETKRQKNIEQITKVCISVLKNMDSFDWNTYQEKAKEKGHAITLKRDKHGKVCGYYIMKGNSRYKSSDIGHSRNLTPSRIEKTWEKLHPEKFSHVEHAAKQEKEGKDYRSSKPASLNYPKGEPVMCHHDIEVGGQHYSVDIPKEIDNILQNEVKMPDNYLWSTIEDVKHTAMLLFAGYINAAIDLADSCGGGSGSPSSDWGRDDNEDEKEWARRCAQMAHNMHNRPIRRFHR